MGLCLHVSPPSKTAPPPKKSLRKKPQRWKVERSHSFLNRFRRLLVRWEKREDNYVAMLHLAMGIVTWFHSLLR